MKNVLVKTVSSGLSGRDGLAKLEREHNFLKRNPLEGLLVSSQLRITEDMPFLVFEDPGGRPVLQALGNAPCPLDTFLFIALEISLILERLHSIKVVHGFITPDHVLFHPESFKVWLTGLYHHCRPSQSDPPEPASRMQEGLLAYVAPEQAGCIEHSITESTDLYSLGAVLYELLARRPLVDARDMQDLMRFHLRQDPKMARLAKTDTPFAVQALVQKLLNRDPLKRYQTARGLRKDLEVCLRQFWANGWVDKFPLGKSDHARQVILPGKLFGRQAQTSRLRELLKTTAEMRAGTLFVSGLPGIGKTALVEGLQGPVSRANGFFANGKFLQFHQNRPFGGLVEAASSLVHQASLSDPDIQESLRVDLANTLSRDASALLDFLPEARGLVHRPQTLVSLPPMDARARFFRALINFFKVFAQVGPPLVLFLDDLQWGDPATFEWLEKWLEQGGGAGCLLILAYRENECPKGHPVHSLVQQAQTAPEKAEFLQLPPLSEDHTRECVLNMLPGGHQERDAFTRFVFRKTSGNPFFIRQILETLQREKHLTFDLESGQWSFAQPMLTDSLEYDNLQRIMEGRLRALPIRAHKALSTAALLGWRFSSRVLAGLMETSHEKTMEILEQAVKAGLVIPQFQEQGKHSFIQDHVFVHDRLQQTALAMLNKGQLPGLHWKAGQLLLDQYQLTGSDTALFGAVHHFGQATGWSRDESERTRVAEAIYEAAKKTRKQSAFETSWQYLEFGIDYLPDNCWEKCPKLATGVFSQAAEAAHLTARPDAARELIDQVIENAPDLLDKIRALDLAFQALLSKNELNQAIDMGCKALDLLGVRLPRRPSKLRAGMALAGIKIALAGKSREQLAGLPFMEDSVQLAAMPFLLKIGLAGHSVWPPLVPVVVARMIKISLAYGVMPDSSSAFATYGFLLVIFGNIDKGYQMGMLAEDLMKRWPEHKSTASTITLVNSLVRPWKEHLNKAARKLETGFQLGISSGNYEWAAVAAEVRSYLLVYLGMPLEEVNRELVVNMRNLEKIDQKRGLLFLELEQYPLLFFMGADEKTLAEKGTYYLNPEKEAELISQNDHMALCILYANKKFLAYYFGDHEGVLEALRLREPYKEGDVGSQAEPLAGFYHALSLLALKRTKNGPDRKSAMRTVDKHIAAMETWASHAPMNFLHKFHLMEAEKARVLGKRDKARQLYDQAAKGARRHGFLHEEGLALELFARFLLIDKKISQGKAVLAQARRAYLLWGAHAKVRDLDKRLGILFEPVR